MICFENDEAWELKQKVLAACLAIFVNPEICPCNILQWKVVLDDPLYIEGFPLAAPLHEGSY